MGAQQGHGEDRRSKGDRVDHEDPAGADGDREQAGRGRADQACTVERRRVECHRVRQLVFGDEFGDERLAGWRVDRRDNAEAEREQIDVPELGYLEHGQNAEAERQ